MKIKKVMRIPWFFLFLALSACGSKANPQIVEVTRVIPKTVEITRLVTQIITSTTPPQVQSSTTLTPAIPTLQETPVPRNAIYDQGILLITQYYTFLGHGLYSEAYQLLSTSNQKAETEQQYIEGAKLAFKKVQINDIQPFIEWRNQEGAGYVPRPGDEYKFTVDIIAWGEGNMSGSVPSGQPQEFWITIIQENGVWKIDQFATA